MKGKIFQVVLVLVLLVVTSLTGCIKAQEEVLPSEPSLPPEFFLDSDGDGFNDGFEVNIAGYDPNAPNDRYIIIYFCLVNDPSFSGAIADSYYDFFVKKGGVPSEDIALLKKEEANAVNLRGAIEEIASKSDKNDIVFLYMAGHGGPQGIEMGVEYAILDKWLDQIEAKAVITTIMACSCEAALPILKDGPCPRILFVQTAGEFIGALGQDPDCVSKADTEYGNNDGYVSLAEIGNWRNNQPRGWKDNERGEGEPGDGFWNGQSWLEKMGFSLMSDTSNIAHRIYLTDYKIPS